MAQQCWAYDKQRRRCEKPAGHDESHGIVINWTDDECYDLSSPARPQATVSHETGAAEEAPKVRPCVACKHTHKGGSCKCGCHSHIG